MNFQRRLWILSLLIVVILALFSLRIVYWQLIRGVQLQAVALDPLSAAAVYAQQGGQPTTAAPVLNEKGTFQNLDALPQPVLQRTIAMLRSISRGSMLDRNGQILVSDQLDANGNRQRVYADPSLVFVTGYTSALRTGLTGLERSYNDTLLGVNRLDTQLALSLHEPIRGSDLVLTIDDAVQKKAAAALGKRAGAVVVLDGHTGAVLALVGFPRFDPNHILEDGYANGLAQNCDGSPSCTAPFIDRATQSLYTPGSIFKTVTLIAGLDTHQITPDTTFDFGTPRQGPNGSYYVYSVGGGEITDPNHKQDHLTLPLAYAYSANAAFAKVGDEMSPETFIDYARRLGFSQQPDKQYALEVEYTPSRLANSLDDIRSNSLLRASTAIGQGELLTSPMNMAMVFLSVLNNGDLPMPYFVEGVHNPDGSLDSRLGNRRVLRGLYQSQTAQQTREMMITAVKQGSGYRAILPGLTVGGKTGTAQLGGNLAPHAWFAGFADNGKQSVVIVVVVENGGEGSAVAAPIFAQIAPLAVQAAVSVDPKTDAGNPITNLLPTLQAAIQLPTAAPTHTPEPSQPTPTTLVTNEPLPVVTLSSLPQPDILRDPSRPEFYADQLSCPFGDHPAMGTGKFIWPSQYQALSGADYTAAHPGMDFSTPMDAIIYASDSGVVIFAGYTGVGYGNVILIDHRNGYKTLYAHLDQVSVRCGDSVAQGKVIGLSGKSGNATGPHLHFEVRVPGGFINPIKVLPTP